MKKKVKSIQKFIIEAERELAAKYFTMSNTAMLEVVPNSGDLNDMYRKADEIMTFECGASLRDELNSWRNDIAAGDSYCFEQWQKVREKYVKSEVPA